MISVIIPIYNRKELIKKTLNSLLNQTYTNWECLVVDDYSSDGTKDVIEEYSNRDHRIKYILNMRSKGAQGARNTGLMLCKGDYINFFDSDDIMHPNFLYSLFSKLQKSNADIVTCFSNILDEHANKIGEFCRVNEGNIYQGLITGKNYVDYNCALIRRNVIEKFGLTDEDCPSFQEWDTHLRLSKIATYTTVSEYLVDYYIRNSNTISSNPRKTVQGYVYIFKKYHNDFCNHLSSFHNHGLSALNFAKQTKDLDFIEDTRKTLKEIIPNFDKFLIKNFFFQKANRVKKFYDMFKHFIKKIYKFVLKAFGKEKKPPPGNYISCEKTVTEARALGLSVCDYVEKIWDQQGQSEMVIEKLSQYGFFKPDITLLEIGAGTGRYIDHVLKKFNISTIYSYETALDWSYWLEKMYAPKLVRREADGFNLSFENDQSIDNITAHGVFVYLPVLHSYNYFKEMSRVLKPGGWMAFDIYDSENFNLAMIETWLMKGKNYYPVILDKKMIIEFFKQQGIHFIAEFNNKHGHSFSTYLIFHRDGS